MKKFIKKGATLAGLVAAGAIGAAALAPTASASPSSFISNMDANGFYNGNGYGAELQVGYSVCNSIAYGWRPIAVAHGLWLTTQLDAYESGQFTAIAVSDLCPQYAYLTYADALHRAGHQQLQRPVTEHSGMQAPHSCGTRRVTELTFASGVASATGVRRPGRRQLCG